jgi:hypothetical protein
MFVIHMPVNFKVGDTAGCRINGEPSSVTWRDKDTLVIEPDDARTIELQVVENGLRCFICSDADGESGTIILPDFEPSGRA